jgi:hypothetical protein
VEGGVLTLLLLAVFGGEIWRKRRAAPFLAAAGVLAAALAWTCAHNKAVTGDPLLPPYLLHQRMYVVGQPFWFLPVGPEPEFSHPRLASHFGKRGFDVTRFSSSGTSGWRNYSNGLARTLEANGLFLGPGLLLFLVLPFGWRSADYRKLSIATMGFLFLNALVTYHFPHYQAPLWAVLAVMTAMASEQIWRSRAGRFPAGAAIVALALTSPLQADLIQRQRPRGVTDKVRVKPWPVRRAELIKELSRLERRQLVLVRYPAPDWKVNCEWVYNGADIDSQRVIFAHDLGEGENRALLSYYPDRDVVPLTVSDGS